MKHGNWVYNENLDELSGWPTGRYPTNGMCLKVWGSTGTEPAILRELWS